MRRALVLAALALPACLAPTALAARPAAPGEARAIAAPALRAVPPGLRAHVAVAAVRVSERTPGYALVLVRAPEAGAAQVLLARRDGGWRVLVGPGTSGVGGAAPPAVRAELGAW